MLTNRKSRHRMHLKVGMCWLSLTLRIKFFWFLGQGIIFDYILYILCCEIWVLFKSVVFNQGHSCLPQDIQDSLENVPAVRHYWHLVDRDQVWCTTSWSLSVSAHRNPVRNPNCDYAKKFLLKAGRGRLRSWGLSHMIQGNFSVCHGWNFV